MDQLEDILKNLRVPQLFYTLGGGHQFDSDAEKKLVSELTDLKLDKSATLIDWYKVNYRNAPLRPVLVNSLFLSDRLFDGYFRKNLFSDAIVESCNKWRYLIAFVLVRAKSKAKFAINLLKIIDVFLKDHIGSGASQGPALSQLARAIDAMNAVFFSDELFRPEALISLLNALKSDSEKQKQRREKLVVRLMESETGLARADYANAASIRLVFGNAQGKCFPVCVIDFLTEHWQPALKRWFSLGLEQSQEEELNQLTADVVSCLGVNDFAPLSQKTSPQFMEVSPDLVDRLSHVFEARQGLDETINQQLSVLQSLIIQLFQNQEVETELFPDAPESFHSQSSPGSINTQIQTLIADKSWLRNSETDSRFQIAGVVSLTGQLVLANQLGAKIGLVTLQKADESLRSGVWKPLPDYMSLEMLFEDTVKGLNKVSEAQLKQRQRALEKAKAEALALKEAKERAANEAREKAERIKQAAEKKALEESQRIRLALESKYLTQMGSVTLGAWVEYERNGKKEKGKLAVKTSSTQKWIFVDRFGLNRFEIIESDLLEQLIQGRARILNSGAEFDESLERTVSRIRMSKK